MSAVHPLENHVSLSQLDNGAAKASADAVAPLEDVTYIPKTDITRLEEFNLFQCARNGDFEGAKNLLGNPKVKASINNNDADGLTPLHLAARYNYFELVKLLVENGAEVDTEDNERMTPLMYACRLKRKRTKSRESMAKLSLLDSPKFSTSMTLMDILGGKKIDTDAQAIHFLISHGANVAHKDAYHMTPLHHAALRGDEVACEQLLIYAKQGALNVNAQDVQRMSPLHTAVCQSHSDIVRQLLKAGADARSRDEDLSTPLHEAATIGNTIIGSLIFDNCVLADGTPDVDKENLLLLDKDEDGNTPFVLAVGAGKTKFIQFLIKKGADINVSNNMRMTPLHLAAIDGDVQIMEILVEKGAKIDVMNQEQQTPLHKACTHNSVACIEYLLKKGANKEAKDFENFTPLALAVVHGHVRVVQMLLAAGSDVTVEDKNDSTLVFLAAEENKLDVLKVLMTTPKIKELINHRDEWNNSPLHVASQNGHVNVVKFLIENGAMVTLKNDREQTPIHLAAIKGYVGVVQAIVAHDKTTLNDHDENSDTALHLAASNGHVQLVHVLLTLGANHEIMNSNLQTPIAAAAADGHLKVVELLVRAGAFIDIPDKLGLTPLLLASMNGHFNVVEYLLERQADVTLTDKQGLNCLDLAVKYDQQEVVMDILKSDVWENALRNTTIENGCVCTPLRRLIRKMPEAAEKVFDNCITSKKVDGGPNEKAEMFEVKYNFEFLDDLYSITHWKEKKKRKRGEPKKATVEGLNWFLSKLKPSTWRDRTLVPYTTDSEMFLHNHPLIIMVNSSCMDLLDHPLVTALQSHKWNSFGKFSYYFTFITYCIFLGFLTGYVLVTPPPFSVNSTCTEYKNAGEEQHLFAAIGKYVILILSVANLLKEMFQAYLRRLLYLNWENLLEVCISISSFLYVLDVQPCQNDTGYRYDWQWNLGAIAIVTAWLGLVMFIQKFAYIGIYVVMFTSILQTFFRFFIVFLLFIIAFGLGFYALIQNQTPYATSYHAIIRTLVMMIGEMDYNDIFHSDDKVHYWITYVLICIFLIVMSIIIMNLLVGLAVDDIKGVQDQASLKRLAMKTHLVLDVERLSLQFTSRWWRRELTMYSSNMEEVIAATKHSEEFENQIQKSQRKTIKKMEKLKSNMKTLNERTIKIEQMLNALLHASNIQLNAVDTVTINEDGWVKRRENDEN